MSGHARILIYAELLSNIRQISVGCSLPSACSSSTEANISPDGQRLTIRHEGEELYLQLPGTVTAPPVLPIPKIDSRSLSWRLPLSSGATHNFSTQPESQPVPWSASDLAPGCSVKCRKCENPIISEGTITVWKDLPSENWAEMMEFWHCHKPDTHDHDHDHAGDERHLAGRGYGANSRISGQAGTGFVDLTSLLFFEKDCTNLTKAVTTAAPETQSAGSTNQGSPVNCSSCTTEIGVLHDETSSVTLYKWQLTISSLTPEPRLQAQPSLANCVASMLTSTLSRSGCSKSIILPMNQVSSASPSAESLLHIWLFNRNISFTSSALADESAVPAVKVLYRFVSKEEADRLSESMTSDVQDITLPSPAVDGVRQLLGVSNEGLPEGDRRFKEWTVGLLEKWKT
ncbi:putative Ubiquitin-conjugating enzyme E2C-binding protein [Seiridium cardinale]